MRARKAWGDGFDSAWMARINTETARIARSFRLPRGQRSRRGAERRDRPLARLGRREPPSPIPDDVAWIIESEIRKQLRGFTPGGELPFDLSSDAGERRSIQRGHDPSRPILCDGLEAVAHQGCRAGKFHGLIRDGCGMLVVDGAFRERRRGRKWVLDPGWLFREAYVRERTCEAIAAEAEHPVRNVIEVIRRVSHRLQDRLLAALALPPEVVADIIAKAPIRERVREQVLEALQAFVAGEATDDPGADAAPRR